MEDGNPTVVDIRHVSKNFVLPHERVNTVKSWFTNWYKLRRRSVTLQHALDDINVQIQEGEFFGIVGRNGSGKSTLLKIIAGIYQPTKGSVRVNGRLVPFIELGIGFNAELTGRENVYLNGAMLGFSSKQIDEMYHSIVEFAELERFMDQKLKNYSSGMQVRLAFSMAIRAEADILLIDEVLAVGDADFQRKCYSYFKSLKRQKKTVILVTHDMSAVREYCDRAMMIEKTHIVAEGSPDDVAQKYTELFIEKENKKEQKELQEQGRWGEGKLKYQDITVESSPSSKQVVISCKVKSFANLPERFSLGFRIRNEAGLDIFGTNTRLLEVKDLSINPQEMKSFVWKAPNILSDGKYTLITSILDDEGATQDFIENQDYFEIRKPHPTGYPVQPNIELERLN